MSARFEAAVWSGIERRLADVEGFIPDAPPWSRSSDAVATGAVRRGPAFGRPGDRPMSRRGRFVLALTVVAALLALIAAALLVGAPRDKVDRLEQPFGPFGIYRPSDARGSATVLSDGRVLLASGTWQGIGAVNPGIDVWDPVNGRAHAGTAEVGRVGSAATLLLDGRVLITGGYGGPYAYPSSAVAAAEIWDPGSGAFSTTGSMAAPRVNHTATLLRDGRVLVIGGAGPDGPLASAEIWDPRTATFLPAGNRVGQEGHHTATLLPSGDVLVLGTGSGEIWRVAAESFTPAPEVLANVGETTATPLLDGRLLVIHGGEPGAPPAAYIASADGQATFPVGSLLEPRSRYATTLLPDGRVLITGGVRTEQGAPMTSVEVFDPGDGSFREALPLGFPVADHVALLLPDGRVLIVFDFVGPAGQAEPLLYDPGPAPATE